MHHTKYENTTSGLTKFYPNLSKLLLPSSIIGHTNDDGGVIKELLKRMCVCVLDYNSFMKLERRHDSIISFQVNLKDCHTY